MKAGVITFHNALNYGAVLQTYALQTVLTELGCNAQIINYSNTNVGGNSGKAPCLTQYHNPFNYMNDKKIYEKNRIKEDKICKFSEHYIKKTKPVTKKNIADLANQFDVFFTGSDQVWNDKITGNDDTYYLDFVPKQKRYSYAASIGGKEISENRVQRVKELLSEFQAISVRESTACAALQRQADISATQVLDPTLLLMKNHYKQLIHQTEKKPYVLLYMLFYSKSLMKSAKKQAKKLGIPVYCINASGKEIHGVIDQSCAGIEEWIDLFWNAEFVFTNSFHGTVFSILFERKFNVELPPEKVNAGSRLTDLLKLFHLEDQMISNVQVYTQEIRYNDVLSILQHERKKSIDFLRGALMGKVISEDIFLKDNSIISMNWKKCSGCGLCEKICPVHAIQFGMDYHGFQHPCIDVIKCVQCGKCLSECPVNAKKQNRNLSKEVYAAYSAESSVVKNSSSGGIFFELAQKTIQQGGIVYGAAFTEDFTLQHCRVESVENIKPLMGSKYVQSDACIMFDDVRKDLRKGRKVLFVGSPCQVAALQEFCQHDNNLLAVDFVCHGVPSPKILKDHIKYVEKYFHSKVIEYYPRSKILNWGHHELFVFANGKRDYENPVTQAYKNIFHSDCGIRSSCYQCEFTNFERPGDLTIADYWGIEQTHPELYRADGVSMVLVNTEQGKKMLRSLENVVLTKMTKETILEQKQPHLFHPLKEKEYEDQFWQDYQDESWEGIVKKYADCNTEHMVKWKVKRLLRTCKKWIKKG